MTLHRTGEHPGRITDVVDLTPLMRRITIDAPSLPTATLLQDVAVVLPDPSEPARRTVRRRYTVRDARAGTVALEAVLHGHGPGAAWASRVEPGDDVVLYGPRGGGELPAASGRVLVLSDDAGLPAVLELLPALAGRDVTAVVEVAGVADEQPAPGIAWRHRDGRPAGEPDALVAAVRDFAPRAGDAAFVLAESRVAAAVREQLLAAGIDRADLHAKGYWNRDDPRRGGSRP